jgi:hypothetical protein
MATFDPRIERIRKSLIWVKMPLLVMELLYVEFFKAMDDNFGIF